MTRENVYIEKIYVLDSLKRVPLKENISFPFIAQLDTYLDALVFMSVS